MWALLTNLAQSESSLYFIHVVCTTLLYIRKKSVVRSYAFMA